MSGNTELSFRDFVHQLNADEHASRVVEAFESEQNLHWICPPEIELVAQAAVQIQGWVEIGWV
jgi:hypothetical protein